MKDWTTSDPDRRRGLYHDRSGNFIPDNIMQALLRYIEHRIKPGEFLQAVLANDLKDAVGRADSTNISILHVYVTFLYNEAPAKCWGSREAIVEWCKPREFEHPVMERER
jgi:hypothetical protein